MMYDILQFLILMLNVLCALYYSYQAGKLKGLNMIVSATLNHEIDKNKEGE